MLITSLPTASEFLSLDLPEINRDWWLPGRKILEAEYIATSSTPAGFARQVITYDISSIKKTYNLPSLDYLRAETLAAMANSDQTSWIIDNGTERFVCNMEISMKPLLASRSSASIVLSVIKRA